MTRPTMIALTGATGFVGQMLLEECERQGLNVRALTRRDQDARAGVEWVRGDLNDKGALAELVRGVESVIHLAGVVSAPDVAGFEEGNVTGTLNLIEACVAAGTPRFLFVSSLSAREPQLSAYGASKHRAEKLVMASGLDWTIIRPPAIYGPRDTDNLELFKLAKWGVVPMPPKDGRASWIHVGDLCRLLLKVMPSSEATTRKLYEVDDGRANGWTHYEIARAIGWAVDRRPWVPHLSEGMLRRVSAIERFFKRSDAKLTPDRVGYMVHPDWVANAQRAVPRHIWRAKTPMREGMKATANWYKKNGWL